LERAAGKKRASSKKGRRPANRIPLRMDDPDTFDALERAGFVVAKIERSER
jgi:hypothetical protein